MKKIQNSSIEIRFQDNFIAEEYKGNKVRFSRKIVKDGEWVNENKILFAVQSYSKTPSFPDKELWCSFAVRSIKSGIIEYKKEEDEPIVEGDILCVIHPYGVYSFENSPLRPTYSFYFDKYKNDDKVLIASIKEWFRQDGDLVEKGEKIFSLFIDNDQISYFAEKKGYLEIIKTVRLESYMQSHNEISHYELMYIIRDEEAHNEWKNNKFKHISQIIIDDFTGNKTIKWHTGAIKTNSLDFSFNYINNKDYLVFNFSNNEIKLKKDDNISFLFENGRIINFKIIHPSYKINEYSFENKVQITDDEIMCFEKEKFSKWKISYSKTKNEILGGGVSKNSTYKSSKYLIWVIQKLAKEYRELVRKEIPDYKPLLEGNIIIIPENSIIEFEECYVYLMIDTINQYYKIGISNKPSWREKTLQSEKPSIELIAFKKFVSRRIALSIEKAFHNTFSDKRIRGEWFQLDEIDVEEIKITLTN